MTFLDSVRQRWNFNIFSILSALLTGRFPNLLYKKFWHSLAVKIFELSFHVEGKSTFKINCIYPCQSSFQFCFYILCRSILYEIVLKGTGFRGAQLRLSWSFWWLFQVFDPLNNTRLPWLTCSNITDQIMRLYNRTATSPCQPVCQTRLSYNQPPRPCS